MSLMTTDEAAAYLKKKAAWLRENRESLGIPGFKLGQQWRFKLEELDDWLEMHR